MFNPHHSYPLVDILFIQKKCSLAFISTRLTLCNNNGDAAAAVDDDDDIKKKLGNQKRMERTPPDRVPV